MQEDDFDFIDEVYDNQGFVIAQIHKGSSLEKSYVVVDPPAGLTTQQLRDEVDAAGLLEPDGEHRRCTISKGEVRLEEVLPDEWPGEGCEWTEVEIVSIGDCALTTIEENGIRTERSITGNGTGSHTWHDRRLRELVSVGDRVHIRLTGDGRISMIRHPAPKLHRFSLDLLSWRGVSARLLLDAVASQVSIFRRDEVNIESGSDGWKVTTRSSLDDEGIIEFVSEDGVISPAFGVDGVSYGGDYLILQDMDIPESAKVGMVGCPLSRLVALPFDHCDPDVTRIRTQSKETFLDLRTTAVDLREAASG